MHPDNPLRIAIKYLTFIAPPVILFVCSFILFQTILAAIISTVILLFVLVVILAIYVNSHSEYTERIQQTKRKATSKINNFAQNYGKKGGK